MPTPFGNPFGDENDVSDESGAGAKKSSVERGTSNKALEAYKRRHVKDDYKGVVAHELDCGTMGEGVKNETLARLARDEEKLAKGEASYIGEHFNAI